jgi:ribosomal protein L33
VLKPEGEDESCFYSVTVYISPNQYLATIWKLACSPCTGANYQNYRTNSEILENFELKYFNIKNFRNQEKQQF